MRPVGVQSPGTLCLAACCLASVSASRKAEKQSASGIPTTTSAKPKQWSTKNATLLPQQRAQLATAASAKWLREIRLGTRRAR